VVRGRAEDGPSWLSDKACRAIFREAIERVRDAGELEAIEASIRWPGYRRRLRERVREWTAVERPARGRASSGDQDAVAAAEWAVYVRYRSILAGLNGDDDAGMAVWASRRLARSPKLWPTPAPGPEGPIVFVDLDGPEEARLRVVAKAIAMGRPVHATLDYEPDSDAAEVYLAAGATRERLLALGLEETTLGHPPARPAGLSGIERTLFRGRDLAGPAVGSPEGLAVRGAPRGDGCRRVAAREVRALLHRGVPAEEILVLYRHWDNEAELTLGTLNSWGIAAHADWPRPLRDSPAVSALRLAMSIPLGEWETELIVRLLRHGQVRPEWPGIDRLAPASAASTIRSTLVFRGRQQLLRGLDRALARAEDDELARARARQARTAVEQLSYILLPAEEPRPWAAQAAMLRQVAGGLGIGAGDGSALDPLWEALDDQTDALKRLGHDGQVWSWERFAAEIDAMAGEVLVPAAAPRPGSVRLATVDQAGGARAKYVILAGLEEGTFPARGAVEPFLALGPVDEPDRSARERFGGEMLRFLRVLGSADAGVTLVYPTTDLKGQEILRAGFLDDLLGLLTSGAAAACHRSYARIHPALVDQPDLAGTPGDARVLAAALAGELGETGELGLLARDPEHRRVLEGTAAALHAQQRRMRGSPFSEYEGRLADGSAILEVDSAFGPDFCYSASQLETYLSCPFHFFSKYVLNLKPVDERDELDEDYTERGSKLHDILESFERKVQQGLADEGLGQVAEIEIEGIEHIGPADATDLDLGLWEIERGRLKRTIQLYVHQRTAYDRDGEFPSEPHEFELKFGERDTAHPVLELAHGRRTLRLRGRIDRVDLVQTASGRKFRVIDYKSGSAPTSTDVRSGAMLQLPLYAMAVQQLVFADDQATLHDIGYWSLREEGFKPIAFENWEEDQEKLLSHVLATIDRIRGGVFVVHSRKPGCEQYCEYRGVCRVRQARSAGKRLEPVDIELSVQSRRGRRKGAGGAVSQEAAP
jgi:RecB family exonuclease